MPPASAYSPEVEPSTPLGVLYPRGGETCIDALVSNAKGLHLRPSGAIMEVVEKYTGTPVRLENGDRFAVLESMMDVAACGVTHNTRITFASSGPHAEEVLRELYKTIDTINRRNYDGPEEPEEEY